RWPEGWSALALAVSRRVMSLRILAWALWAAAFRGSAQACSLPAFSPRWRRRFPSSALPLARSPEFSQAHLVSKGRRMTAINVFLKADKAIMMTDGALYNLAGEIVGFGPKALALPTMGCV